MLGKLLLSEVLRRYRIYFSPKKGLFCGPFDTADTIPVKPEIFKYEQPEAIVRAGSDVLGNRKFLQSRTLWRGWIKWVYGFF